MITVKNAGNTEDTIDLTLSGAYSLWGSLDVYTVILQPNGTQDILLTIEVPADAAGGDYVITVTGTSQGDPLIFYELDITTTVEPWVYDVNLFSDIYEQSVRPGDNLVFNITVENLGDIEDTIDLSISGDGSQWGTLSEDSVTLGLSESQEITLSVNVPSDAPGGDYEIIVRGTSQGNSSEYSEIVLTTTVVPYVYDVHLSSDDLDKWAKPGQTMVFNIMCENKGDIEDTYNITISQNIIQWCTLADDSFVLGPGVSDTTTLEVAVPSDAAGGDNEIFVTAVSLGEPTEYHEIILIATVEPWIYGLELITSDIEETAFPGESVTYSLAIENLGELNDTFDFTLSGSYVDWGTLSHSFVSLAPHSTEEVFVFVEVPSDAYEGDYEIGVRATSQEDNSVYQELTFSTSVTAFVFDCDLNPENQYADVEAGEGYLFQITVENTGNYQETVSLELSGTKAQWGSLDVSNITLDSGEIDDVNLWVYVPLGSQPGNFYFTIEGTIIENPYTSDSIRIKVTVPEEETPAPEISVSDVQHEPDRPNGEEIITVNATVNGEDIRSVKLQLFENSILLDSVTMQYLGERGYSVSYGPLEPGEYEFTIFVEDQFGNSHESSKFTLTVVEPPPEDSDEDGVYDDIDAFPRDDTQWSDFDGDGFGDNPDGNNPDYYPRDPSKWSRDESSEDDSVSWSYILYILLIFCVMVVLITVRIGLKNKRIS
jgi:uncharacterized membrane protein